MDRMEPLAGMPLIGEKAPPFTADSTRGTITFPDDFSGRWVVFFSHPADFTPVCTTEIMALAAMAGEFREMNVELLGLSVDSLFSHIAWLRTIRERVEFQGLRNIEVRFPVIADIGMEVARRYGMVHPGSRGTLAVRAVFIIDPEATVRAVLYYPPEAGRNLREVQRLVAALQTCDRHHVATPANWEPGDEVVLPPPATADKAEERVRSAGPEYRCADWFLCLRRPPHGGPETP